jgi:hypothetical protein
MARRSILVALAAIAALAAAAPPGASAATAPAAPVLTSAPFTVPVSFHWTPSNDPLNLNQAVYRGGGVCTTPVTEGTVVAPPSPGIATNSFTDNPVDGVYCYYIKVADLLTTANSPGLTVVVDTTSPTATVAVSNQVAGAVSGTVTVSGTSADAVSGVGSSVLHVGAAGACPSGPAVSASWDTTTTPNGAYDVCNVVTDNAGHVVVATTTVTVANAVAPAVTAPGGAPAGTVTGGAAADKVAPGAPRKLIVTLPRAKAIGENPRPTLHWLKPKAADLARVIVVLSRKHPPRSPSDGTRIYRGLRTSVVLNLTPGQRGFVALFAVDRSGNVSKPARRIVSPAVLIPLRPLSGSVVVAAPRLSWKPRAGSAYYNVQVFRNGTRVLVGWPARNSYDVPAGALTPGTYVWFVWPAVSSGGATPAFADLIGRATFVVKS